MSTDTVQWIYSALAVIGIAALAVVLLSTIAELVGMPMFTSIRNLLNGAEVPLAFVVAAAATGGSLYFSEVAGYIPCELCWWQRIFMYPLVPLLALALFRRERAILPYTLVLAVIGAGFSIYHYQLERFPNQGSFCKPEAGEVPCTSVWFEEFGFITIAMLALVAFGLVGTLSLIGWLNARDETAWAAWEDEQEAAVSPEERLEASPAE